MSNLEKKIMIIKAVDFDQTNDVLSSPQYQSDKKRMCGFLMRKSTLIAISLASILAFAIVMFLPATFHHEVGSSGSSLPTNITIASKAAIFAWETCNPVSDSCPAGYICCVAPADVSSGKATCRLSNLPADDANGCAANQPSTSLSVTSTSSTVSSYPVTSDNSCGPSVGLSCPSSLPCCSQYGWCGSSDSYCGTGTQSAFAYSSSSSASTTITIPLSSPYIPAYPVTPDNSCGPTVGFSCPSSLPCCSQHGWCGSTYNYCGVGTLVAYAFEGRTYQSSDYQSSSMTHYNPSTGPAFCNGVYYNSGSFVVAMSTGLLNNHNACGKQIIISVNGNSVSATVVDMCNERDGCRPNNIDSTPSVWRALGIDLSVGVASVDWRFA